MRTTRGEGPRHGLLLAGLLLFGLGACGDDDPTGPGGSGEPFDPQRTAQTVAGIQETLDDDSDVVLALALAGDALAAQGGTAALLPESPAGPVAPLSLHASRVLMSTAVEAGFEQVLPSTLLGRTFVWNVEQQSYVLSELGGAPANGIRFLIYAMDPVTRLPVTPLSEIGHIEFTDEGDPSDPNSFRVGVLVETGGVTRVDYFVDGSFTETASSASVTVSAEGFISDGTVPVEFDLAQSLSLSGAQTLTIDVGIDYAVSVPSEGVGVAMNLDGSVSFDETEPATLGGSIEITDGVDTATLTFESTSDPQTGTDEIDGSIAWNGIEVVLVGGTTENPVFTNSSGDPLTEAEIAALEDIFDVIDDLFDFANHVFEPLGGEVETF